MIRKSSRPLLALIVAVLVWASAPPLLAAPQNAPEIKDYVAKVRRERARRAADAAETKRRDLYPKLRPYQTYDELDAKLDLLLWRYPQLLSGGEIGVSVDGRPIRFIKLNSGNPDAAEVLVTANIHGHELVAGQVAMGLLEYLAAIKGQDLDVDHALANADLYFIFTLNPDLMDETARRQARWGYTKYRRKNRNGVDLNRNFPYPPEAPDLLADASGSPDPNSQTYRGPYPLSEPESAALADFIDQHRFLLAINYHSAAGMILYPPATFPEPTPDTPLMAEMAQAYANQQFDPYQPMPEIDLYPTIGSLDDYIYHRNGVLSFTVEIGKNMAGRAKRLHNQTYSPVFWGYNVHDLHREIGNNVHGAVAMIQAAIRVHHQPKLRNWRPPDQRWVGEPPLPVRRPNAASSAASSLRLNVVENTLGAWRALFLSAAGAADPSLGRKPQVRVGEKPFER